jgi:hypothetical protein
MPVAILHRRNFRWRILTTTWLAYADFYLCRKNYAIVKSQTLLEPALRANAVAVRLSHSRAGALQRDPRRSPPCGRMRRGLNHHSVRMQAAPLPSTNDRKKSGFSDSSLQTDAPSTWLERLRIKIMARQQFVKIRPIPLGEARSLADIAGRNLQNLRQVIARKLITCIAERGKLAGVFA